MAEITALRKHPCPECGGDAEWNASKQALVCPYCGTVLPWSPGENTPGQSILEQELDAALRRAGPETRDWRFEKREVKCQSCQAITVFEASRVAQRCEFCGSPSLVPVETGRDAITPTAILPAKLSEPQVRDHLRQWYASRLLAPDRFKKAALTDTLHGLYLPYWTFDARVHATWTAMAGFVYFENVQRRGADGRIATVAEQRVRWEPAAGELDYFFDDDLVPGTIGLQLELLRKVEPFPTRGDELKPYDPAYVRGWIVERYQVDLRKASELNRAQMDAAVRQLCAEKVPGDTSRQLQVEAQYQGRTFKHILVPAWLVSYTYGSKSFQIVVNGHTGAVAGDRPISYIKVFVFIVLPALILILLFLFLQQPQ
jgi:ribosomal protein S27E